MRFGTWNVRSLYRAGSLTAAARELARCKSDLVGVQEVRWDRGGKGSAGDYNFFYKKGKAVPLQAWSGPEASRKLRFPDYVTTVHDGGKVSRMHRPPLPPGNVPGTHFC